ncbi:ribosomal protein S6 kinase alpha-5-like isoform X2 [Zootermopsis nevadensis]|uniref:ribosomal protein S6 kinase alpha-5-like isoform X2 n=1 Tax=Zootermopsis nevadensis TaxID=136037 RepID=UPI000B8EA371|nr:ribosomal protein S6 kinase alpha-5-like isoform X2 [Zootermopsis nevadensis]
MDYFPGGDMRQYISRQGKLTEVEVKYYLAEIILAIQHLHEMQIIHRDLKPENLLLDSSGHIAVADYGLCKFLSRNKAYSFCGTEGYLAPEMFSGRGYSKAVDWWSIGILTYEMLTGSMPFTVVNQKDMTKPHFRVRYRTPVMPKHFSPEVVDFITRLLDQDPRKRLGGGKDDIWKDINWADVARKATVMPRVPRLNEVRVGTVQKHCTMDIFLQPSITLLCKGDTTLRGYSFMSQALIPNGNSTSGTYQKCPNMVKLTPKRRALQVTTKRGHHTPHINVMKKPKRQARRAIHRPELEEYSSGPSTSKTVVKKDVNRMECKRKLERDSEESVIPFKKCRIDKPSHRMTTESECTPQINMFIAPEMPARGGVQLTTDRRRLTSRTNVSRIPETRARTALHRQHLEENFSGPSTSKTVVKKDVNRMARKRKLRRQPFKKR